MPMPTDTNYTILDGATAEQWEQVARFLAFNMLKMPDEIFKLIAGKEIDRFINGEDDGH